MDAGRGNAFAVICPDPRCWRPLPVEGEPPAAGRCTCGPTVRPEDFWRAHGLAEVAQLAGPGHMAAMYELVEGSGTRPRW